MDSRLIGVPPALDVQVLLQHGPRGANPPGAILSSHTLRARWRPTPRAPPCPAIRRGPAAGPSGAAGYNLGRASRRVYVRGALDPKPGTRPAGLHSPAAGRADRRGEVGYAAG